MIRRTAARRDILEILRRDGCGVDAAAIVRSVSADRATVYRQLGRLTDAGEVCEVSLGDGKKRYELAGHHHHVVCKRCGRVEKVDAQKAEFSLELVEKRIAGMVKFKQVEHSLEFFGLCGRCV